ncbi:hypothetical protein JCM6882_007516 [Rhodosporidiobolus microsporus]
MWDQECCICGAKTNTRCSACGKAGLDIFFCSTDHQKLIWPVHKRVCSVNANPFRHPSLTPAAAAELKRDCLLEQIPTVAGKEALVQMCGRTLGVQSVEDVHMLITGATEDPRFANANFDPSIREKILLTLRAAYFFRGAGEWTTEDTFSCLASFEFRMSHRLDPKAGLSPFLWPPELRHALLVLYELKSYVDGGGKECPPKVKEWAKAAMTRIVLWVNGPFAREHGRDKADKVQAELILLTVE